MTIITILIYDIVIKSNICYSWFLSISFFFSSIFFKLLLNSECLVACILSGKIQNAHSSTQISLRNTVGHATDSCKHFANSNSKITLKSAWFSI